MVLSVSKEAVEVIALGMYESYLEAKQMRSICYPFTQLDQSRQRYWIHKAEQLCQYGHVKDWEGRF